MFNVPVVEPTAQAATEQSKLVSEVSDSLAQFRTDSKLAAGKKTMLTIVRGDLCYGEATPASEVR